MLPLKSPLIAWMDRVAAVGHGTRETMTAADALRIAREATPEAVTGVEDGNPCGLEAGTPVLVRADDANDPIHGILVAANPRELVIAHENDRIGTVHVHFPRFGYSAVAAQAGSAAAAA